MKQLLIYMLVCICSVGLYANEGEEDSSCQDPLYIAKLDSLKDLVSSDDREVAIEYAKDFLKFLEINKDQDCKIYYYTLLEEGKAYSRKLDLEIALTKFHDLLRRLKDIGHYDIEAFCYIELELVHEFRGGKEECLLNLNKAKKLIDEFDLKLVEPQYYIRRSSFERMNGTKKTAIRNAELAIDKSISVGDKQNELDGYLLLGLLIDDSKASIKYLRKAAQIYEEIGDFVSMAFQYSNMHKTHGASLPSSAKYLDTAKQILNKINVKNTDYYGALKVYYEEKKNSFKFQKKYDSAFHYLELQNMANYHAIIVEDNQKLAEMELRFNLEQANQTIKEVEESNQNLTVTIIAGLALLTLFGFLVFSLIQRETKIKTQSETIEKFGNKNEMLLSEVHHRVKNNLQNIIGLITLKLSKVENEYEKIALEDISSKIFSMALIHEQLYQEGEFEKINISEYVSTLIEKISHLFEGTKKVDFAVDINAIKLNIETTMPLGMIITELINNSVKHNDKNEISIHISVKKDNGDYVFSYLDDGKGLESEKVTKPNTGLKLIKSLARQLRSKIEVNGENGYKLTLRFKEKVVSSI